FPGIGSMETSTGSGREDRVYCANCESRLGNNRGVYVLPKWYCGNFSSFPDDFKRVIAPLTAQIVHICVQGLRNTQSIVRQEHHKGVGTGTVGFGSQDKVSHLLFGEARAGRIGSDLRTPG